MTGLPPGPRGLLGPLARFARDPVGAHQAFRERWGDPFTLRLPGMRMVVTGDAATIRRVLSLPAEAFTVLDIGSEVMGEYALLRLDGPAHAAARRQVAPLVMNPLRGDNGRIIQEIARRTFAETARRSVRMIDLAKALTLEVILHSVRGPIGQVELHHFAGAYAALQSRASFLLHFVPALQWDLGPWSPWGRIRRARAAVDRIIADAIARAAASGDEPLGPIAREASEASDPAVGTEALRHQVFTLLSAGHASTAQALAWATWHVFSDRAVLARLRGEVDGTDEPGRLVRLDYLDAVCREVLRLHPIGPVIGRKLALPLEISGWTLAPGTVVGLSVGLAHTDPQAFPDAGRFQPERFLSGDRTPQDRAIPFGGGVRHCLGANLGLAEMKLALAELVRDWDVRLGDAARPAHRLIDAVAGPASGVPLQMEPRQRRPGQ